MRLCLLIHSYLPESTPPRRRWEAFVRVLVERGWQVDVIAPAVPGAGGRDRTGPAGETIRRTRPLPGLGGDRNGRFAASAVHALQSVPLALTGPRPDLVVATVPALPMVVPAWVVSRLLRRPLVLEMRDAWPDLAREAQVRSGPLGVVMERLVSGVQRAATQVVTVTAGFGRRLAERGVRAPVHIANGISLSAADAVPRRRRSPGDDLHVLYLGNHGESQGLELLLHTAARLRDAAEDGAPRVRIRMVGDGTRAGALRELNRRLGDPVEMLPAAHGAQAREHYAWADTAVVMLRDDWPSFAWTVPSKTYELLAVGLHVTGVVVGEAAELLHDALGAGPVAYDEQALAAHLTALAADPGSTDVGRTGRRWVRDNAELAGLGGRMADLAERVVRSARAGHRGTR